MRHLAWMPALLLAGCAVESDTYRSSSESIDGGTVEMVRAEITMGAGELEIDSGAAKLLEATFRYSENLGKPEVRYDATGFRGRLTVEAPRGMPAGKMRNEWKLKFGDKYPLDLSVRLGAGEGRVNLASLPVRKLEVNMGAGELKLDLRGSYTKDVEVDIKGGVGAARIQLPRNVGVVADAKGGIGSLNTPGLTKRGDLYYNAAFSEGKPAVRLTVRGGIGEMSLIAE